MPSVFSFPIMTEHSIQDYLSLAIEVAREAGDYAYRVNTNELKIASKSNEMDLVTEVDGRNEKMIRDTVLSKYSDHSFLGEELGASAEGEGEVRWIIDPIDGTVNFAHGLPIWCVSIGVEVNGQVECGVIYNPNLKELFTVRRGHGAFLNGKQIHVSSQTNYKQGLFVTGFPYNVHENPDKVIEQFVGFLSKGLLIRRLGSAALDLSYVACGRMDGFWELKLSPWDMAAGALIVEEAGGRVTLFDGSEFDPFQKQICASNGLIHDHMLTILTNK